MIEVRDPQFDAKKLGHSQFGEEGIVEHALAWIGVKNRWCFEVGASDGETLSNTKYWRDQGWDAVLIEASEGSFQKLKSSCRENERAVQCKIEQYDLDRILAEHGAPRDMDFGSLDIDGQDWYCWSGMIEYRPRVMIVEIATGGPGTVPEPGKPGQAGIHDIDRLAYAKYYTRVGQTHCNAIYVANEAKPK